MWQEMEEKEPLCTLVTKLQTPFFVPTGPNQTGSSLTDLHREIVQFHNPV